MTQNASDLARRYEDLVQSRRRDAPNPLIPKDHRVNWNDAPSKFDYILRAERVPLSPGFNCKELRLGKRPWATHLCGTQSISIEEVSDLFALTLGITGRKLSINWSVDGRKIAENPNAIYSRGTASGGGLYPVSAYLLARDVEGLRAGIFHYDNAHHSLSPVRLGKFDRVVTKAIDFTEAASSDLLIVLTLRFWKSCFKYHNFSYQVATQDVGACLGSLEQVAYSLGWNTTAVYWFHDKMVGSLLGLDFDSEAPFAILTATKESDREGPKPFLPTSNRHITSEHLPVIQPRKYERSRNPFLPEMLREVHGSTLLEDVTRPSLPVADWPLPLEPASHPMVNADLTSILMRRETTWGGFRRDPPLTCEHLGCLLKFVAWGLQYETDLYRCRAALPSLRIDVIARNVSGLPQGAYRYDFYSARLFRKDCPLTDASLQSIYFLANHNLDQVSALVVLIGRIEVVLKTLGARGIRLMNAEAGIAAQRTYIGAAALSLGCGAVLGFDGRRVSHMLELDSKMEMPLTLMLLGNQCPAAYAYEFALR
jgi:SagB-type dehydrogenase family enzyme